MASMHTPLVFLAGSSACEQIREKGLAPGDIQVVLGASGAAKWLVLYGLDRYLFTHWFRKRSAPLHLFGTSIGAWKFAAAAQRDPAAALDRLKQTYISQTYPNGVSKARVGRECLRMMDELLAGRAVEEILGHPFLKIGFSAVRCKGIFSSHQRLFQAAAIWSAFELNLMSRKLQSCYYERTFFHSPGYDRSMLDMGDFPTISVGLGPKNFAKALLASGSIPMVMAGVRQIPGAPKGVYRDGGILDYHPLFPLAGRGLILYPHFYPWITPGWFDKKLPWRRALGPLVDRVVLVAPSREFVARLPGGRIPDRQDLVRLPDQERIPAWETAARMGETLGAAFHEIVESGRIRACVQPLS